jgi:hypothetical protein
MVFLIYNDYMIKEVGTGIPQGANLLVIVNLI